MKAVFTLRTTLLGLASWAIPFAVSFLFFDRNGELTIARELFKSIMVVVGGASGAALLVTAFRKVVPSLALGVALGFYWFAINIALDLATLVALMHMNAGLYVIDIGLRYLMLPIMAGAMGAVGGWGGAGLVSRSGQG
jgi:hypothetical protein